MGLFKKGMDYVRGILESSIVKALLEDYGLRLVDSQEVFMVDEFQNDGSVL